MPDGSGPLDHDTLSMLLDQPPELVRELMSLFVCDAQEQLAAIPPLVEARDGPALQRLLHRLKGGCLAVGANLMAERCRVLEAWALAGEISAFDSGLPLLEAEFRETRDALGAQNLLDDTGSS